MIKVCEACGREFDDDGQNARKYCSPECAKARKREQKRESQRRRRKAVAADRPQIEGHPLRGRKGGWDADGRHRRFRERAMKAKPWLYEFADSPELLS